MFHREIYLHDARYLVSIAQNHKLFLIIIYVLGLTFNQSSQTTLHGLNPVTTCFSVSRVNHEWLLHLEVAGEMHEMQILKRLYQDTQCLSLFFFCILTVIFCLFCTETIELKSCCNRDKIPRFSCLPGSL